MRETITYRFNKFKQPHVSFIPTLIKSVRGMKFGKREINDAFRKFAVKGEYAEDERDMILEDIYYQNEHGEKALINKDIKND